jgi:hypothetical protein
MNEFADRATMGYYIENTKETPADSRCILHTLPPTKEWILAQASRNKVPAWDLPLLTVRV